MKVFYVASVVWVVQSLPGWPAYLDRTEASPLWPGRWYSWVGAHNGIVITLVAYLCCATLALFFPEHRIARAAYAIALLEYMAFVNGFGKVGHPLHAWFFVAAIFVLLPNRRWDERRTPSDWRHFLGVFWLAQLVVLFFYTLTGAWKVGIALTDMAGGRANAFQIDGFSSMVGRRLLIDDADTIAGTFIVRHEWIGFIAFLATMYIESVSLLIAFRPRLHSIWGGLLVVFHIGTELVLGFVFTQSIVLVSLLLVLSPLSTERAGAWERITDLPIVHALVRRVRALGSTGPIDRASPVVPQPP